MGVEESPPQGAPPQQGVVTQNCSITAGAIEEEIRDVKDACLTTKAVCFHKSRTINRVSVLL